MNAFTNNANEPNVDMCNHWVDQKDLNLLPLVLSRMCSYFLLWYPVIKMFKRPQHMKRKSYYNNKKNGAVVEGKKKELSLNIS